MRNILCQDCDSVRLKHLHPDDAANGFQQRVVKLRVKKPADHCVEFNGVKQEQMETIKCDQCGQAIPDGTLAIAVSMWRGGGLADWEHEYGEIIL